MPYEKVGKNEPVCIADEVPFEIPGSWEWVRISDIFQIEMGQSPKGDSVGEFQHGIEFHQGKVYFGDKYIQESKQRTTTPTKIAEPNSVLLCVRAPVGKVNITNRKLCIGRGLCALKPLGNINIDFAFYLMETYESIFVKQATGTTFVAITGEVVKNQLIPLPPLGEQIRILEKIRKLLPLIKDYAHVEQANEKLTKDFPLLLKKSILQEAVQGKLVQQDENDEPASVLLERIREEKARLVKEGKIKKDKNESVIFRRDNSHYEKLNGIERCIDDEIPFEIPENWCWCRLGSIASILGGKRIPAGRKLTKENTGYTYIRVSDMKDGCVSTDDLQYVPTDIYPNISKYIINKEDVFITVAGTIGRVGKIPHELDGANLTENADRLVFTTINQDWLIKELQSSLIQTQIADATTKVGQPKLAIARIERLLIALPPLSEQHRIVSAYNSLLPFIEQL